MEKLIGISNYRTWSIQVRSMLESQDLWQFVDGTNAVPRKDFDESNRSFDDRCTRYRNNKSKARALIIAAVSSSLVLGLGHTTTAEEAWDTLRKRYQPPGMAYRCSAWLDWVSFDWNGKDLDKFCNQYMQKLHAMDAIGVEIKEEFRIYMFIQRIDPYFKNFAADLHYRMRNTSEAKTGQLPFTLEGVISRLLDDHSKHRKCSHSNIPSQSGKMLASPPRESPRRVASSTLTPTTTTDLDDEKKIPEDEVTPSKQTAQGQSDLADLDAEGKHAWPLDFIESSATSKPADCLESQFAAMDNTISALNARVQELESEVATLSGSGKGIAPFQLASASQPPMTAATIPTGSGRKIPPQPTTRQDDRTAATIPTGSGRKAPRPTTTNHVDRVALNDFFRRHPSWRP